MTTEITKASSANTKTPTALQKVSVMNALAAKLECDPSKLMPMLKKTVFATCRTDEEFMAMCMVANTYGLNPLLKEVYAFPGKNGNVLPIVGVDGWIKLMNSNPAFDGIDFEEGEDYCTATIYRKDRNHPIKATEWLAECVGKTEPWARWPKRMLRHKAMIQCARIAFGFAGIYDEDEARRIDSVTVAAAEPEPADADKAKKKKPVNNKLRAALHMPEAPVVVEEPQADPQAPEPDQPDLPLDATNPADEEDIPY